MDDAAPAADEGPTLVDVLNGLHARVASLEARLEEHVGYSLYFGGLNRLHQAAVQALVQAAEKPELLEPVLRSTIDSFLGPDAPPADPRHIRGMEAAHELLTLAMRDALAMSNTAPLARH